jgi:uncharacterized lipoprotein YmbA
MPRSPHARGATRTAFAARVAALPLSAALLVSAVLGGCATVPPETVWLKLPVQAPQPPARGTPTGDTWQLLAPVRLPGHLDRDALMLPSHDGLQGAMLRAADGLRWAEPLRDALPRLLRDDLETALAAPLWRTPLPPGVTPTRQLRIELLALDVQPGRRAVALQARFSIAAADGRGAPLAGDVALSVPIDGGSAEALALAHRQAIAVLAARIADAARSRR